MVDNFELLKYQINTFPGCFYHLQIIKRNKDHASMRGNNRTIKQYYVEDADYLLKHREEIISLCEMFGARAYINLSPKSYEAVSKECLLKYAVIVKTNDYKKPYKLWDNAAGSIKGVYPRWVVDLDKEFLPDKEAVLTCIRESYQAKGIDQEGEIGKELIKCIVPTKTGEHIITSSFPLDVLKAKFPNLDVHKNNPTILYIPRVLDN